MKRFLFVTAICLLLVLLNLTGCASQQNGIQGEVLVVSQAEEKLLLKAGAEEILVCWEEDTLFGSWMMGVSGDGILDGSLRRPTVWVFGKESLGKENFQGKSYPVYQAEQIFLDAVWEADAYTLADGTQLDLRRSDDWKTYYTKDGRPLLRENRSIGPHNVTVGSLLSFDHLGEAAQGNIKDWYDRRGLLYNLDAQLERAWADYRSCEEKLLFQEYYLGQEIVPTAYNEELIWFATSVITSIDQGNITEEWTCQAFRRDTGEPVDMASLFRWPEEEILEQYLDISLSPGNNREELRNAFQMTFLNFSRDRLEIWFPAGSLPSEDYTWILSVEYEELGDALWDWAVPVGEVNEP